MDTTDTIDCIYPTVCFPCIAEHRINEILATVEKEKRVPTDAEIEEAEMFQRAMIVDIQERSIKRTNLFFALQMGIV
jgi:hypothetical protein